MTELEKLAVKLANTLLSTPIGHVFHPVRVEEERIDMTVPAFSELRKLAELILEKSRE